MKKLFNEKHEEIPDDTPVEWPLDANSGGETLAQMVKRLIEDNAFTQQDKSLESFEEFNDLDIDDDEGEMILSSHQRTYEQIRMQDEVFEGEKGQNNVKDEEKKAPPTSGGSDPEVVGQSSSPKEQQ